MSVFSVPRQVVLNRRNNVTNVREHFPVQNTQQTHWLPQPSHSLTTPTIYPVPVPRLHRIPLNRDQAARQNPLHPLARAGLTGRLTYVGLASLSPEVTFCPRGRDRTDQLQWAAAKLHYHTLLRWWRPGILAALINDTASKTKKDKNALWYFGRLEGKKKKRKKGKEAAEKRRGKTIGVGLACAASILFKEKNVKVAERLRLTLSGVKTTAERMEGRGWTPLYLFVSMDDGGDDWQPNSERAWWHL